MGRRVGQTLETFRACTLSQLENRFGLWVPQSLFPKAPEKANSRDRIYTRWRTFWSMLWQGCNPNASGREVVRQIQALSQLQSGPEVSEEDGAYCRAKARLPLEQFPKALAATAQAAYQAAPTTCFLQGRHLKVVDGTTLTLPDTSKNRKTYPPKSHPNPTPSFPQMRVVVVFCFLGGAILHLVTGNLHIAELPMLHQLFDQLVQGDVLMGDRGFGNFVLLGLLQNLRRNIDFIGRSRRKVDGRCRDKRLGKGDWLVQWERGSSPSPWMPLAQWLGLPEKITVRIVRGNCHVKGFRVRQITLVTTLLDAQRYPASEILQAYLRRWRLEMCLDDLKTTLGMEMLRSRSPEMAEREIYTRLIAHNLIRCTMAYAAVEHTVPLERMSFKGTLDALRQFTQAMGQARSLKKRSQLWDKLLETLAADLLPERPGRREPRAVKRVKRKYPRLRRPRHQIKDRPKPSIRRAIRLAKRRLQKLGLTK
jgi:hypothetical protein